jgi:small subunit ribosomal protein S17
MAEEATAPRRRLLTGKVIAAQNDKTVTVEVQTKVMHPRYRKYVSRRKNYMAHDEENECGVGDTATIRESRPISKRKRWVVVNRSTVNG